MTNVAFSVALAKHRVAAVVKDYDYKRTGVAIETEYIIQVEPKKKNEGPDRNNSDDSQHYTELFEPFRLSKTYSAFRSLASQLQKIAKRAAEQQSIVNDDWNSLPLPVQQVIQFTESVALQVNKQRTEYLGKVSFSFVKSMSTQRSQIVNDVLDSLLSNFPTGDDVDTKDPTKVAKEIASAIELFFLTDHVDEEHSNNPNDNNSSSSSSKDGIRFSDLPAAAARVVSKAGKRILMPTVIPVTSKSRASLTVRQQNAMELEEHDNQSKTLILNDDENDNLATKAMASMPQNKLTTDLRLPHLTSDVTFLVVILVAVLVRRGSASWYHTTVTMDSDIFLLILGAVYFLGLHTPRAPSNRNLGVSPEGETSSSSIGTLLRKSMIISTPVPNEPQVTTLLPVMKSPMDVFPNDAPLGSKFNCWSQPCCTNFIVRGPNYFTDKVKCPSEDFIFPCRGVDLFLTDVCPENVGRIGGIMGGHLRDLPSLIINYRLPWGVLLFYYEIPERFFPFLYKRYDPEFTEMALPSFHDMSPADRTVSRFILGDDKYRDERFKIIPVVVQGPWIAKSVVGGKPAILGKKVPIKWMYQPREGDKAMYLEADLDIVSSSAARGILSVLRSCTSTLTIDLGYIVEAQEDDELPECMLTGSRIHGIQPTTAAVLPPMKDFFMES